MLHFVTACLFRLPALASFALDQNPRTMAKMKRMRNWLAALALACAVPAHAGQYSDLWWNPAESGWGVNIVQQLDTAFVTLFVYGTDGKPTWYVAPDTRVTAYSSSGLPLFGGALYRTTGPWHGGVFNPAQVTVIPVGQLSLEVLSLNRMRVRYSADGADNVVKEVTRQTWDVPLLAANYAAQFILRQARPGDVPFGTRQFQADVLLHLDAGDGQAFIRVDDHLGIRCEYRGPYAQTGKLARVSGTFTCSAGDATEGSFELSELEVSEHGITGFLRTFAPGLNSFGRFAAARY